MEAIIWGGSILAAVLLVVVAARWISRKIIPGSRARQEQLNNHSTMEAEILTRSKGPFV